MGIDILIDNHFKPHLIEVNNLPSFRTDTALDRDVKSKVVKGAISVMKANARDKFMYDCNNKHLSMNRLFSNRKSTPPILDEKCRIADDETQKPTQEESGQKRKEYYYSEPVHDEILLQEEQILGDGFDRIFPPPIVPIQSSKPCKYYKMIDYIFEEYNKQQIRLLNPVSRPTPAHDEKGNQIKEPNNKPNLLGLGCRRDSWIDGSVHSRGSMVKSTATSISHQPTKKQLEAMDRLYRGFSVAEDSRKNKVEETDNAYITDNETFLKVGKAKNKIKRKGVVIKPVNFEFYGGFSSLLEPDHRDQVLSDYMFFHSERNK